MKGVAFTEFLDMVDDKFGVEVSDNVVARADRASGGGCTAVGTYDHGETVVHDRHREDLEDEDASQWIRVTLTPRR